jgi:transcriptional regulator with XRE-family HTH domain
MWVTTDPTELPPERLGFLLRSARQAASLSHRKAAKRSAISGRRLKRIEKGGEQVDRPIIDALLDAYEIDVHQLIPPRRSIGIDGASLSLEEGGVRGHAARSAERDDLLHGYLTMIAAARNDGTIDSLSLRKSDVEALANALGNDDQTVTDRIAELLGCDEKEASALSFLMRSYISDSPAA